MMTIHFINDILTFDIRFYKVNASQIDFNKAQLPCVNLSKLFRSSASTRIRYRLIWDNTRIIRRRRYQRNVTHVAHAKAGERVCLITKIRGVDKEIETHEMSNLVMLVHDCYRK